MTDHSPQEPWTKRARRTQQLDASVPGVLQIEKPAAKPAHPKVISERSIEWLRHTGTPSTKFIERSLLLALNREPTDAELEAAASIDDFAAVAKCLEKAIHHAVNHRADGKGGYPRYRQLFARLIQAERELPDALREDIPGITDMQIKLITNLYNEWRENVVKSIGSDGAYR